jgi:hypothetical protein
MEPLPPLDVESPLQGTAQAPGSSILSGPRPAGDRWILSVYLGAVVLPLSLGLWAAAYLRGGEVQRLQFEEDQRMGAAAVFLLERDLEETTATLARRARPLPGADREIPGVQAALAGDTVTELQATEGGLEVTVLLPSGAVGVAFASAPFQPGFLQDLAEAVGYDAALYVSRARRVATVEDFGPDTLPFGTNRRLALFPEGMPLRVGERWASLHPRNAVRGRAPEVSVLVSPVAPRPDPFPHRIPLLSGLVALSLGLAGWWLLVFRPAGVPGDRWQGQRSLSLVWIPLALVLGLITVLGRTFPGEARRATVQELSRAMALARTEWERLTPRDVQALTGFPVTVVEGGAVVSTTLGEAAAGLLASVPPPPSAVALTGQLGEGREEMLYMAARLEADRTLILTAPGPRIRLRGLGVRLFVLGVGLLFLVLIFPMIRSGGAFPRRPVPGQGAFSPPAPAPH